MNHVKEKKVFYIEQLTIAYQIPYTIIFRWKLDAEELRLIFNAIDSGRCLAFLGAGACSDFTNDKGDIVPGLPSGKQLTNLLVTHLKKINSPLVNGKDYDLMSAAELFLYEYSGDRDLLEKILKNEIQNKCNPRPIHTALAQLKQIKFIITTNYDILLEEELRRCKRNLIPHVHDQLSPRSGHFDNCPDRPEDNDVILHKMHGTIEKPETLIITKSDYIRYLSMMNDIDRGMPEYIRKWTLPRHTLLFLGYSLEDWNFQVIWEGVLSSYNDRKIRKGSFALVKHVSPQDRKYWAKRDVDIIECDLTDFAKKLAEHYNLDIPQLNLAKKPAGGTP